MYFIGDLLLFLTKERRPTAEQGSSEGLVTWLKNIIIIHYSPISLSNYRRESTVEERFTLLVI